MADVAGLKAWTVESFSVLPYLRVITVAGGSEIVIGSVGPGACDEESRPATRPALFSFASSSTRRNIASSGHAPPAGFWERAPKLRKTGLGVRSWRTIPLALASGR